MYRASVVIPKHQAMIQKNTPRATALNFCKGTNAVTTIPGINTMNEYFIPFAKQPQYSRALIFNNGFKYRTWIVIAKHTENNVESDAPINPKYFVAGYIIMRKKIVLTNEAVLYLSGLPVAKKIPTIRVNERYKKENMQYMLKGIAIVLCAGEYINVKIGRAYTIMNVKKGRPKVATISVNWNKEFFNFSLSS